MIDCYYDWLIIMILEYVEDNMENGEKNVCCASSSPVALKLPPKPGTTQVLLITHTHTNTLYTCMYTGSINAITLTSLFSSEEGTFGSRREHLPEPLWSVLVFSAPPLISLCHSVCKVCVGVFQTRKITTSRRMHAFRPSPCLGIQVRNECAAFPCFCLYDQLVESWRFSTSLLTLTQTEGSTVNIYKDE